MNQWNANDETKEKQQQQQHAMSDWKSKVRRLDESYLSTIGNRWRRTTRGGWTTFGSGQKEIFDRIRTSRKTTRRCTDKVLGCRHEVLTKPGRPLEKEVTGFSYSFDSDSTGQRKRYLRRFDCSCCLFTPCSYFLNTCLKKKEEVEKSKTNEKELTEKKEQNDLRSVKNSVRE